jgi:hypothetical protein
MTFKVVFLWAILRGILDYLTGRTDLRVELTRIRLARAMEETSRAMQAQMAPLGAYVADLGRGFYALALHWQACHLAHPELWQQPHDERWRR